MATCANAMKALSVSSSLSYRVNTWQSFLIFRKLRSTTFLPLYRFLLYLHGSFRLLFGGTTGRIPHCFAFARQASPCQLKQCCCGNRNREDEVSFFPSPQVARRHRSIPLDRKWRQHWRQVPARDVTTPQISNSMPSLNVILRYLVFSGTSSMVERVR